MAGRLLSSVTVPSGTGNVVTTDQKGAANGVAALDSSGKLVIAQGGTGGTSASAARAALGVVALDSQVINVKDHGVLGDGSTDDSSALNTVISGAAAGSVIYFPPGTYIVGSTITIYSDLHYVGSDVEKTVIKMKAAANLAAVAATVGWVGSTATSSVDPVHMRYLTFDGNSSNQTSGAGHGLVLQTYYSNIEYCNFQNTRGDGIRLDSYGANGTTAISNNGVENRFFRLQCRTNGGNGININDPAHNKMTDGWIVDCIVDTPSQNGIWCGASAGWKVDGCHIYNVPYSGIRMDRAYQTRIINNYVESAASSTTSGFYYLIDCVNFAANDGGFGSAIVGNTCYLQGPIGNAGSTVGGIGFQAANSGSGNVTITGNQLYCTGQSGVPAISLQNQSSSASLTASVSGNNLVGWSTNVQLTANSGPMTVTGNNSPTGLLTLPDANFFLPEDHSFIAWSMDPATTGANGTQITAGYLYLVMVVLRQATTISKINTVIGVAGATLTSSQNYAGLYSTGGTRLALTADMSTTWNSAGNKTMSLTASYNAAAGKYYVALLFNGTTSPYFACGSTLGASFTPGNAGLSSGGYRFCRSGASGNTSLPSSITVSGYTGDANNLYAAVL